MQDVQLGLLVALLPTLAGHKGVVAQGKTNTGMIHEMLHVAVNSTGTRADCSDNKYVCSEEHKFHATLIYVQLNVI